jgi:glutamate-ammonia-ligase adenylyltransferase
LDPKISEGDLHLEGLLKALTISGEYGEIVKGLVDGISESPNPRAGCANAERLISSATASGLIALLPTPAASYRLGFLLGSSQFLADLLVKNPEYVELISDLGLLLRKPSLKAMEEEARGGAFSMRRMESRLESVRRWKNREMMRIAAADLLGFLDLEDVTAMLSSLAAASISVVLDICMEELRAIYGSPRKDGSGGEAEFIIVGMGKLGGWELNYSSDVDLIFIWDGEGVTDGGTRIGNGVFFKKLSELIVKSISSFGSEGRLYRVDMRLRPFGDSGPLSISMEAFTSYCEQWSEPWERQAMIKGRVVAGSPGLGDRFTRYIEGFVYGMALEPEDILELVRIRERMDIEDNIKKGRGGIRDVEFVVQILGLIGGLGNPELRVRNTFEALRRLKRAGMISEEEGRALESSYRFLRTLEHRLQIIYDTPLFRIPKSPSALRMISRMMGYDRPLEFLEDLKGVMEKTREIYNRIVSELTPGGVVGWVWDSEEEGIKHMEGLGFRDPRSALRAVHFMLQGPHGLPLPRKERRKMLSLIPSILKASSSTPNPDLALLRLQRFGEAFGNRVSFFESLAQNPKAMEILARIGAESEALSNSFLKHPEYIDELMDPSAMSSTKGVEEMVKELLERIKGHGSLQDRMRELRIYKKKEMLRIGMKDIGGMAGIEEVMEEISDLGEASVRVSLLLCSELMGKDPSNGFSIIAHGKLAGKEMHYSSDLDIAFITSGWREGDAVRLSRMVMEALQSLTEEGYDFKVDTRLRIGGETSPMVQTIDGYERYMAEGLSPWERVAFVRSRWIAGDRGIGERAIRAIEEAVFCREWDERSMDEIRRIRGRVERERALDPGSGWLDIKLGRGGIMDIELIVQITQIIHGKEDRALRNPNIVRAIGAIGEKGIMGKEKVDMLIRSYTFLRLLENRVQIVQERAFPGIPLRDKGLLDTISRGMGIDPPSSLLEMVGDTLSSISRLRMELLGF